MAWDRGLRPLAPEATDLLKVEERVVSVFWVVESTETTRFPTFSSAGLPGALRGAGRPWEVEVLGGFEGGGQKSWEALRILKIEG